MAFAQMETNMINENKIGYKNTKVGWIPNDWEVRKLGDIFDFKNGINADKSVYGNGIKFINVMDVFQGSFITYEKIKGQMDLSENKIQNSLVVQGDILFNRTSEVNDEIGMGSVYLSAEPVVFGGFVIKGHPKKNILDDMFKKYCFATQYIRKDIIKRGQGAIRSNIGQKDLEKVQIFIPPLSEQKSIADILSTWDDAIEKSEKLIIQKEKQFKWLLRKLITEPAANSAEKNEPQNTQKNTEWKKVKLGEVCKLYQPKTISKNKMIPSGKYKVFGANGVIGFYDKYNHEDSEIAITCRGATCGTINFTEKQSWITGNAMVASPNKNLLIKHYLYYCLKILNMKLAISGAAQPQITRQDLSPLKILLPRLEQQKKIANALNSAQTEIEKQKELVDKYKEQKRGLMQKLLTGTWRINSVNSNKNYTKTN